MAATSKVIVVGFDGSDVSQRALEAAADLAGYGSTLTIVSVGNDGGQLEAPIERAREQLVQRGILAGYLEPVGDPADELLDAALRLDADVIVLGRRDRSGSPQSVGEQVARRADCDVLLVK